MQMEKIKIAFVNPAHADWSLPSNLTYMLCQSHYNRVGKYPDRVEWLPGLYKWNKYKSYEEVYEDIKEADVIMFSSYIWSFKICDNVARIAKQHGKVTIVGGPHIGTQDEQFLNSRDCYDYFCQPTKPGETFMEDFLNGWFDHGGPPPRDQISWELASQKKSVYKLDQPYSVYEDHLDYLKEMVDYARETRIEPFIVIESTRGCPYQCVYCEWGGGTGTKIDKKSMPIVQRDILALREAGFRDAHLADANMGAFEERDRELFKFAWDHDFCLSDASSVKTKDLGRRKKLYDAWFDIIRPKWKDLPKTRDDIDDKDMWEKTRYISVIPAVSIQSISEEAMKVAKRVDLSIKDKIELSKYINDKCTKENYPVPALELILAMPGSTIEDFYAEMEILWNFKAWHSTRHDYMFLPDSVLSSDQYLKKYNIETVDVYLDTADEDAADFWNSLYMNQQTHFKTIRSCYSFTAQEMVEMWIMNHAGNYLLRNLYEEYESLVTPGEFTKICYKVMQTIEGFDIIHDAANDIYNPNTPPKSIKRIGQMNRRKYIEEFLENNLVELKNGVLINVLLPGRVDGEGVRKAQ